MYIHLHKINLPCLFVLLNRDTLNIYKQNISKLSIITFWLRLSIYDWKDTKDSEINQIDIFEVIFYGWILYIMQCPSIIFN